MADNNNGHAKVSLHVQFVRIVLRGRRLIRTHARSLAPIPDLPQHLALCALNHAGRSEPLSCLEPLESSFLLLSVNDALYLVNNRDSLRNCIR